MNIIMTDISTFQSVLIALSIGLASGAIGAFIVMRRMALVGDALSHVALPGIALALALSLDPFWGVLVFVLLAAWLVAWLEGRTGLPPEALVGILFTASLAIGILTIPDTEIIESLFGAFPALPTLPFIMLIAVSFAAAVFVFASAKRFLFSVLSPELALISGIGEKTRLVLLLVFALIVALGVKLVGTLLMGAITIIPPLIARNITHRMRDFVLASAAIGGLVSVAGILISLNYNLLPGPTIIIFGIALFLLVLPFGEKTRYRAIFKQSYGEKE